MCCENCQTTLKKQCNLGYCYFRKDTFTELESKANAIKYCGTCQSWVADETGKYDCVNKYSPLSLSYPTREKNCDLWVKF